MGGFWYRHHASSARAERTGRCSRASGSGSPLELTEAQAAPAYDAEEQNNIAIYKRVLPSVVNITSTTLVFNFFYGTVPQQGQGSGFVLDKAGHVLTNYHVVEGANRGIEVMLSNKRRYAAKVVGTDKVHDLALLQIDAPNLEPVTLADSSDLSVGQKVYAIGNPFGLSGTMTRGIISSIRSIRGSEGAPIEDAIQTDAAINPGNSGGPLLNSHGEVIGINTMIASNGADQSSGIGFAIPINTAKAVLADLTRYGRVKRPSLGIVSYAIGPDLASQMGLAVDSGVLVQKVIPGGAAERAGTARRQPAGLRGQHAHHAGRRFDRGHRRPGSHRSAGHQRPHGQAPGRRHHQRDHLSRTQADDAQADSGRGAGNQHVEQH